jgi:hypothetical protein
MKKIILFLFLLINVWPMSQSTSISAPKPNPDPGFNLKNNYGQRRAVQYNPWWFWPRPLYQPDRLDTAPDFFVKYPDYDQSLNAKKLYFLTDY